MTIFVDRRYAGNHGIARYAREVVTRLHIPTEELPVSGNPTSARSYVARGWRVPGLGDLIYSPGFGTGRSNAHQLLTIHDLIHLTHPDNGAKAAAHRLYYERLVKPAIKRAGHVLTVSETSAIAIRDWLGDEDIQIHNAGNGCSDVFSASGPRRVAPRPYALLVSNAKAHKNPRAAIRAMALLPEYDLVAVTSDADAIRQMATEAGIVARLTVLSGINDEELASYYRGAACLIFPSILEGYGLPVAEAAACGTPIVYNGVCEAVKRLVEGSPGCYESDGSAESFADLVRKAQHTDARPRKLADSWDSVANATESAIRLLAGG